MADLISRLKLESGEFDAKIARATKGLLTMEKECHDAGMTLKYLDKEQLDFVKGLGQMETVSQDARGKVSELTKAFTELSVQYRRLSAEEKQGQYGRALASSLNQLKDRINEHKSELANVESSLNGVGGAFQQLGSKMGLPMDIFTKFGPAIAAAGAALKVAKDAFNANEAAVDDWGRTVEAAQSIYDGFLTALNTGDFSGFLSRLGSISAAARKAYDELDRLGTMKTIQSPEMSRQQTENERNRMMIQTRRYIAPLDGSAGMAGMNSGDLLSDNQIKQIEADLQNGIQRIVDLVTNEVQQTTNAIEAEYNRQAQTLGMSIDDFKKGTSSMAEFDKMIELAKKYYEFEDAHTVTTFSRTGAAITSRDQAVNPYDGYQKWNVFRVDGEAYNKLVQLIQQRDQQMGQAYSTQSQAFRAINRVNGVTARGGGEGQQLTPLQAAQQKITDLANEALTADDERQDAIRGEIKLLQEEIAKYKEIQDYVLGIKKTTEEGAFNPAGPDRSPLEQMKQSIAIQQADKAAGLDETTMQNLLGVTIQKGIDGLDIDFSNVLAQMAEGADIPDSAWQTLTDKINEKLKELNLDPIELDVKTGGVKELQKDVAKTTDHVAGAAQAFEALGNAMGQIEDPGAKVAGLIANAIASIAAGYGQAVAQAGNGSAGGPWGWIAFAISGLATMISTIAAVKSATAGSYAQGGIVPGNNHNDGLIANVSSGELILNTAQQNNVASALQNNNPMGNLRLSTEISGSNLRVVLNNDNRQRGGSRNVYGVH